MRSSVASSADADISWIPINNPRANLGSTAMRYPDSVEFLYALGNEIKTAKFGLEAIRAVLEALGRPQDAFQAVHVAGTNGKGSTCAMVESALRASGVRTGLYTSPHLVEPTERVRVNGEPVSRDQFADAFRRTHEANVSLLARGVLERHTTYFETVTAMGFLLFRDLSVERAVVEVGLGGRLDATNVLEPDLTVITPIDFDHEQFLGNSLEAIAGEKAGILKAGCPAVFARQRPEAAAVLNARARELGIDVVRASEYSVSQVRVDAYGSEFAVAGQRALRTIHCPLAGAHQIENAVTAVAALDLLGSEPNFETTQWPGRLQRISNAPEVVLDGAHNPAGARVLAEHIRRFYPDRKVWLIYGAMRDKSVQEITEILFPLATEIVLTAPNSPRAVRPEALLEESEHPRMRVVGSAADALVFARSVPPEDAVFITGSLYLVGEILSLLQ